MKKKVLVFGAGGHAKVVIDILLAQNQYEIFAAVDSSDRAKASDAQFRGFPLLHQEDRDSWSAIGLGIIAIGDNNTRSQVHREILEQYPDFEFINAIHPSALIGTNINWGHGIAVMAGTVINTSSIIGDHSIINTKSSIDHDVLIGPFASISPGATLCGGVHIGEKTLIGAGAVINPMVHIGKNSIIGSGSVVVKSIADGVTAVGVPCRTIF